MAKSRKIFQIAMRLGISTMAFLFVAGPVLAQSDGVWRSGEQAYSKTCAYCHEAGVGPVLRGRPLPSSFVSQVVRRGFLEMPAFPASFIDDKTLEDIGNFLRTAPAAKKP